jgi:hypothetical protein
MEHYVKLPDDIQHIIYGFTIDPYSPDRLAIMEEIRIASVMNLLNSIRHISRNQRNLILSQLSSSKTIGHLYDDALLGTKNFDGLKMGPRVRIRQYLSYL